MKVIFVAALSLITVLSVVAVVRCGHHFEKVYSDSDLQFTDDKIAGAEAIANGELSKLSKLLITGVCTFSRFRLDEYVKKNRFSLLDFVEKYARAFIQCIDQIESNSDS